MCTTCGCGGGDASIDGYSLLRKPRRAAAQSARGGYRPLGAVHSHDLGEARVLRIEQDILADNDSQAAANRQRLAAHGIFALNLVSSPGSGKTTLLEKTIQCWQQHMPLAVIEGDQQTANDAERIRAAGAQAVQINTGKGCHLDARMVDQALDMLATRDALPTRGLLLIENVGNLVCPAAFDLGEAHKVVILSVTEGVDKPLKYPDMFRAADLLLISKIDLLPYVDFDVNAALEMARRVRPGLPAICVSSKTGDGLYSWLTWLQSGCRAAGEDTCCPGNG